MDGRAYPFAGHPRTFRAVAMPNGDARYGIEGQLVCLCEQRGSGSSSGAVGRSGGVDKVRYLSRAEAEQLHAELGHALAAFDLAKDLAGSIAAEIGARASSAPYPFRDHRTLAECPPREATPAVTGDDRR